ncbi:MAG: metalloprotease family protein [archaeon]
MVFHELSHLIACVILGVKVKQVKFFGVEEAYVVHEVPSAWKSIIITLAPFILGTVIALLLMDTGREFLTAFNPMGFLFYWFALGLLFYSFPSLHDAKNSFYSFTSFYSRAIFKRGNIIARLFWLITFPFVFIPLIIVLGLMLSFNYSSFLRIAWVLLLVIFSFQPSYISQFYYYLNDLFLEIAKYLI